MILLSSGLLFSQVGINTTNPSSVFVLDVNSSNGTSFGGFMPPRVTPTERDLINTTSADEGLMVYVINPPNSQLQIWDGSAWQNMFPQKIEISTILVAWDVAGLTNSGPIIFNPTTINDAVSSGGLTKSPVITQATAGNAWGG